MKTINDTAIDTIKEELMKEFREVNGNQEKVFERHINDFVYEFIEIADVDDYNKKEKLEVIYELIEQYSTLMKFDLEDEAYCNSICQKIAFRNYKTEFIFQSNFVEEIAIILSYGFHHFRKENSEDDSITYASFMGRIEELRKANVDIINTYRYDNDGNIQGPSDTNVHRPSISYAIPHELILLLNKFSVIKQLTITLDEWSNDFTKAYILIILNFDWLFLYILNINCDLSCRQLNKRLLPFYQNQLLSINKDLKRKSSVGSNESGDTLTNTIESIEDVIISYSNIFYLMILYSFFISRLPHLMRMTLSIPTTLKSEVNDSLSSINITMPSTFNLFQLYFHIKQLYTLDIEFNCLEMSSFNSILYIIHRNPKLKHLALGLFPRRDDYSYSSALIYKTAIDEGITLPKFTDRDFKGGSHYSYEHNDDNDIDGNSTNSTHDSFSCNSNDFTVINNVLVKRLLISFEYNMERLFVLLQSLLSLHSFTLHIDIPTLLSDNEGYFMTLLKFVFNVFLMLHRQRTSLKEVKFIAPSLRLDNRRYPLIEKFFDGIELYYKNKQMTMLHMQFTFISLPNIANVVSINLQWLFLGDLDLESLNDFLLFYQCDGFVNYSKLESLSISLGRSIYDYDLFKPQLTRLIIGRAPKTLREFGLLCNAVIKASKLKELILEANGDMMEKYTFTMKHNKQEAKDYLLFNYEEFYYCPKDNNTNYRYMTKKTIIRVLYAFQCLHRNIYNRIMDYFIDSTEGNCKGKRRKEVIIKFN